MHIIQKKEVARKIQELDIAYKKANHRNQEKKKNAIDFIMANHALTIKNKEKDMLAKQLTSANAELLKIEIDQSEYIKELEQMMHMISHEVRQPITHLQGLSNLFDDAATSSKHNIYKILGYIKSSVHSLDVFTRDFTKYLSKVMQKRKEKI